MKTIQHTRFDQGFNQDMASHLLDEGFLYSARNVLFDKIGIVRKRGGITGLGATAVYGSDKLGILLKDDGTEQLYAIDANPSIMAINSGTGVYTTVGLGIGPQSGGEGARPFQHHGFMLWPDLGSSISTGTSKQDSIVAGADGTKTTRVFTTSHVMVASDPRITCGGADSPSTLMQVGQLVVLNYATNTKAYIGRVTRVVSTTAYEVWPPPPEAGTTAGSTGSGSANASGADINPIVGVGVSIAANLGRIVGGKVGCSFQGRILHGYTHTEPSAAVLTSPRRVYFSSTLLEGDVLNTTPLIFGATWASTVAFPNANYFDIPANEAITALVPTSLGELLIFSAFRTFKLTGNLTTQYGTAQSITWAVREIPNSVGCITERSIQRTPKGTVFAHDSGIYATDGTSMLPLMSGRIQNYWNALVRAGSGNFFITGSALLRGNHYYVCGFAGASVPWALMVNLDTLAWTTISGKATTTSLTASFIINSGVQDVLSPARTWGLKWTLAAASMTGGQLLKLDDMFLPTSANRSDSDGTLVTFDFTTPPYTEGSPAEQKVWQEASIAYNNAGGATVTVTPGFVIDAADMASIAQNAVALDQQDTYTVNAATNASPIQLTVSVTHGIRADSWVRVAGVTGNTSANGIYRVQAVGATTITLMGSVGNAAYISGGTVRAVDQKDISLLSEALLSLNPGQNYSAVAYTFADAAGSDSFELLAITHSYDSRDMPSE